MKIQSNEPLKNVSQSINRRIVLTGFGLSLALLVGLSVVVSAEDTPSQGPNKISLTGTSDWSIVQAAFTPQFLFGGSDGGIYVRHMPLVGRITLSGGAASIHGKISADFNAELDGTFSGPVWASVTITATNNGSRTVIFEGPASGDTVGLVSNGTMKLEGRGPFQGQRLDLAFSEYALDQYNLTAVLTRHPAP
jgi:hypothetical protein